MVFMSRIYFAPRARVRGVVDLRDDAEVQPRVDLRGGDVGVAERFLHRAQVAAGLQQVRGERVAQHVRVHPRRQPGLPPALQARAQLAGGEPRAAPCVTNSAARRARQLGRTLPTSASAFSAAAPTGTLRRLLPCRARVRWRRPCRSSRRLPRRARSSPISSPTRRPLAVNSNSTMRGRAPSRRGRRRVPATCRPAPPPGRPTAPWAAAWRPGRAHAGHRVQRDQAVTPTSGRGRARPTG